MTPANGKAHGRASQAVRCRRQWLAAIGKSFRAGQNSLPPAGLSGFVMGFVTGFGAPVAKWETPPETGSDVAACFSEDNANYRKISEPWADDMNPQIEPQHALSPNEIDAIEGRLYEHNSYVTGRHDGQGLGFVIRDELGRIIAVAAGYTWAGSSELKQMWVDKPYRGHGYARALLKAFVAEAYSRGVRRVWVASYDFQAPGMYEKAGFKRMAEFREWPEGHVNVVLCKTLTDQKS